VKHSKCSPSRAYQFIACPGSLAFLDSLPDRRVEGSGGPAANKGTVAHLVLQTSLEDARNPANLLDRYAGILADGAAEWIADCTESYAKIIRVDSEMVKAVCVAYDYVMHRAKELEAKIETETRTNPTPNRIDTEGIVDVSFVGKEVIETLDYKNGYVPVEAKNNSQLLAYLLGKVIEAKWEPKVFFTTIVQPNSFHREGPIRRIEISKEELQTFEDLYIQALDNVDSAREEKELYNLETWSKLWLTAGDHCFWCRAQGVCPVRTEETLRQIRLDFDSTVTEEGAFDDVAAALAVYKHADAIKSHLDAAKYYLEKAMIDGAEVEGYCLKESNANRVWRPTIPRHKLLSELLASNYFSERSREKIKANWPMTGAQVEKLVYPSSRAFFSGDFLYKPAGSMKLVKKVED